MTSPRKPRFVDFGQQLAKLRNAVGIGNQGALAKLLGKSQQSISRWEAGTSRPDADEIGKLACLLHADVDDLLMRAGYKAAPSVAEAITFDKPLPLESLSPDTFERFLRTVLQELAPNSPVKRAGKTGHKQDGIDLIAEDPSGKISTYQCKRVQTFGPAEVRRAVAAHKITADRKYLVLSRTASPQAISEMKKHPGWEILDREDLSEIVRHLPHASQDRIVDIYFPGRRFELFGRHAPGPWLTMDLFFSPFEARDAAFSHGWALKGRSKELTMIAEALAIGKPLILINGPGGFGKSRLILESIKDFSLSHQDISVSFLSPSSTVTNPAIEGLGKGIKIVVVDDAHDRSDLGVLLEYVANPSSGLRLVLASRPYGTARIKRQAAMFGLADQTEIIVEPLSRKDRLALANEVLKEFGANDMWAPSVVAVAGSSPLITVMAARVIAKEPLPPALATSREELKNFVLGKFQDVVIGDLGSSADQPNLARLLDILAIVQPFDIEDPHFNTLIQSTGLDEVTSSRLIRLLVDGGVIFRRGLNYRLMPDVLGDYIIDQHCIDASGKLTALALKVFEKAQGRLVRNVLLNLGRLDWRINEGNPSDSHLLDQVWASLDSITEQYDQRLEAIYEVAAYQPTQALTFLQKKLDQEVVFPTFAKTLRSIAYSGSHFEEAAELLWQRGRTDSRPLGQNPEHPIRILSELVSIEENKPFSISEKAFEFGMSLIEREDAWSGVYSPLDVVEPILRGEGITTEAEFSSMKMKPYLVSYNMVEPYRKRLIDRLIELLSSPDLVVGQNAAVTIQAALRFPNPAFNHAVPDDVRASYSKEFEDTLGKLLSVVRNQPLKPSTAISLARSVSWHANYGTGLPSKLARKILGALPTDLAFRTWFALTDGYGQIFLGRWEAETWEAKLKSWLDSLVADLKAEYGSGSSLVDYLAEVVSEIHAVREGGNSSFVLVGCLLRDDLQFAQAFIEEVLVRPEGPLARFLPSALAEVLTSNPTKGRSVVHGLLATDNQSLRQATGLAFASLKRLPEQDDFNLVQMIASDEDPKVANAGIRAAWSWQQLDPLTSLAVVRHVKVGGSARNAEDLSMLVSGGQNRLLRSMGAEDIDKLLQELIAVPSLDGYWINGVLAYLSEHYAIRLANFFFERVEKYSTKELFNKSRPVNYGPYKQEPLRFGQSADFPQLLEKAWQWFKSHQDSDHLLLYNAAHLFEAMFEGIDENVVELMDRKLSDAGADDLDLMTRIVGNSSPHFVFTYKTFVVRFLERCKFVSSESLNYALSSLEASAASGIRSGVPGEPFQADLDMEKAALETLKGISRLSPAYRLYASIRDRARWNIDRQRREAEAFEQ